MGAKLLLWFSVKALGSPEGLRPTLLDLLPAKAAVSNQTPRPEGP